MESKDLVIAYIKFEVSQDSRFPYDTDSTPFSTEKDGNYHDQLLLL